MLISHLLKPEQVKLNLGSNAKPEAVLEVAKLLETNPLLSNFDIFYKDLLTREQFGTTCANEIAFPHARTDSVKGMVLSAGRSPNGIWFDNAGQTVKLIFVIGTPKRMVTEYLSVVGGLARILKDDAVRERLMTVPNVTGFLETILGAETH